MNGPERPFELARITAGAILARDVLDSNGQILINQGTAVTDMAIASLHRRGISHLWVRDDHESPVDIQNCEVDIGHHQERLARLFRLGSDRVADRYLLDLMRRYRGVKSS
jgi:hypothetical protein